MSPQQHDSHGNSRPSRQRANTSFALPWLRNRPSNAEPGSQSSAPAEPVKTLPLDVLIKSLTPPAVPSLSYARALVTGLVTQHPTPTWVEIFPILGTLCSPHAPANVQTAGFDVMAAYCIAGSNLMSTADRFACVNLLRNNNTLGPWVGEVSTARHAALVKLVGHWDDAAATQLTIRDLAMDMLWKAWEALLDPVAYRALSSKERQDREKAVETGADFLTGWLAKVEISVRTTDEEFGDVAAFYARVVDRALGLPGDIVSSSAAAPSTPVTPVRDASNGSGSSRTLHRRHPSTASGININRIVVPQRHPAIIAATLFLNHLDTHASRLSSKEINMAVPVICRAIAFISLPLPPIVSLTARLQVENIPSSAPQPLDTRLYNTLHTFFTGNLQMTSRARFASGLTPTFLDNYTVDTADNTQQGFFLSRSRASCGCIRAIRTQVRQGIDERLAALFINDIVSSETNPSGLPGSMQLEQSTIDHANRVWTKSTKGSQMQWTLESSEIIELLKSSADTWIEWNPIPEITDVRTDADAKANAELLVLRRSLKEAKEKVLEDICLILRDFTQELDEFMLGDTPKDRASRLTQGALIGAVLESVVKYVKSLRNEDGTSTIVCLTTPEDNTTSFLRLLATFLNRGTHLTRFYPPTSILQLCIAENLTDMEASKIPEAMDKDHHLFSPVFPDWLDNLRNLLTAPGTFSTRHPLTRKNVVSVVREVWTYLKDMPQYRRSLSELIYEFWGTQVLNDNQGGEGTVIWKMIGEEVVLRSWEGFNPPSSFNQSQVLLFILSKAIAAPLPIPSDENSLPQSLSGTPISPPSSPQAPSSTSQSPIVTRTHTEQSREREPFMSLLSSFTSRSNTHAQNTPVAEEPPVEPIPVPTPPVPEYPPDPVSATAALVDAFILLICSDYKPERPQLETAIDIFKKLLDVLHSAQSPAARLAALQFFFRLRADRDHRVYVKNLNPVTEPNIASLASLIGKGPEGGRDLSREDTFMEESRKARARPAIPDRDGRRTSRGRGNRGSGPTPSRSRSRAPGTSSTPVISEVPTVYVPLWIIPDNVPFSMDNFDKTSEGMITYDPDRSDNDLVLLTSDYLEALVTMIRKETDWEVLSYILCCLPSQLANKHFWCGPFTRKATVQLLAELCDGVIRGSIGSQIPPENYPNGYKARDAQGLAYHILTVLISYYGVFDTSMHHVLVESFLVGLSSKPSTVICCLHALTLAAFELQTSVKKHLIRILEKLSQIMTNPVMAVHIINFLSTVASIPNLYSNFTENDYKLVFGVALQYLQHHNRPETLAEISFALSQHVRLMSYYLVYMWFLAIKLGDRPRHIQFIGRQLELANEGKSELDEPTVVCFDWLSRYTYASADPKPATSLFTDIISTTAPGSNPSSSIPTSKSWLVGHSIVTIKTLPTPGWLEVIARRISGTTQFLCRTDNVPLVGLGDVNPDMVSIPASLMMDKDPSFGKLQCPPNPEELTDDMIKLFVESRLSNTTDRPDPISGYVWSGSAPSQRRKEVDLDPSFFPLQVSPYPEMQSHSRGRIIKDTSSLNSLIRVLDRTPVIDTHKVGILYVAPGQTDEEQILQNTHGSPTYTRFLEGLGRLIKIRGQKDVYVGGLNPDEDGEYAYAWWNDIGQLLYHTATLMPTRPEDPLCTSKKRHIGNDYVRIVWNDSGLHYKFDTLKTAFQFVNIVIEPHSHGAIAAFSNNPHENQFFKVSVQAAPDMAEFTPIGDFKIVSVQVLPALVREMSVVADWYACVFEHTKRDKQQLEFTSNWRARLQLIKRFAAKLNAESSGSSERKGEVDVLRTQCFRDFTSGY